MIKMLASVVSVVVLSLCLVSCRKAPEAVYQEALKSAQVMAEQGQSDKAVELLRQLFDDKRFAGYRPSLLAGMMQFDLTAGRIEAAQSLFREVSGQDIGLASSVVGMIETYLWGQGKFDDLATWCADLQSFSFGSAVVLGLADHHFKALDAAGKATEIPTVLAVYMAKLDEATALGMAQRQFGAMLGGGRQADAVGVRGVVAKVMKDSPARRGTLADMDIDLLLVGKGWQTADEHYRKILGEIPDESAIRNLNAVTGAATKAGDLDAVDALVQFVFDNAKTRESVRQAAAVAWVGVAEKKGAPSLLSKRLVGLKDLGFPTAFVLDQTDSVYSMLLDKGKKEDFVPLYGLYESLYATATDDVTKRRLVWVLLDLGFYLEKYAESLKLVEQGVDGSDAERTAMLTAKIKGHLALQKGQTQEAVDQFRLFMSHIAKGVDYEFDPVDNTRVSKEMILGLNAKRIGDILAAAGKADEATKSYAEARGYYTKALGQFPDEKSKENAKIKKQLAEVPAT